MAEELIRNTDIKHLLSQTLLQKTGEILAEVIGRNLSTESAETEIELNFAVVKIKHKITKKKSK